MRNKIPQSGNASSAVEHGSTILDALKRAEELYGIEYLSSCKSAFRVVERFIEITEYNAPEEVAEFKSKEIALALFDIGMREDPGQFGEAAIQSTQPLEYSDNDQSSVKADDEQQSQSENIAENRTTHRLVLKLSSEDVPLDDYKAERSALADLHQASDKLGLPRDFFVKRKDMSITGPEKPKGPMPDERMGDQVNPVYRPPRIEVLSEKPYLLDPIQKRALWRLVNASCLRDDELAERQDMGSTITSPNTQAIRELLRKIGIDDHFKNSGKGFSRIWVAFSKLLALANCHVEPGDVRQVFQNRKR